MKKRRILVTNALTYANGELHLGHIVGYLQSDIWVRFQRLRGHECYFIAGCDCHGTPIMLEARRRALSPESLVEELFQKQLQICQRFDFKFDHFGKTSSETNKDICSKIFQELEKNDFLSLVEVEQLYDQKEEIYLPDRFIKGRCPCCKASDQYGDNCEECGSTYNAGALEEPRSIISETTPILKKSQHWFFRLSRLEKELEEWTRNHLDLPIARKVGEWFKEGLQDWDITRDAPYYGIPIPNCHNKYLYVWFDAPFGYASIFKEYLEKTMKPKEAQKEFHHFWKKGSNETELYHFIGKDIMYFHSLFWPGLLMASNWRDPTRVFVHGFLKIEGDKMSKSRGTFLKAADYLENYQAEDLRYYLACKLNSTNDDIDFQIEGFRQRVNSDLVNKVVNIGSRTIRLLEREYSSQLAPEISTSPLAELFRTGAEEIGRYYEGRNFSGVTRRIIQLADQVNCYLADEKPWELIKSNQADRLKAWQVLTIAVNHFRQLLILLSPITPELARQGRKLFQKTENWTWEELFQYQTGTALQPYQTLKERIPS